MNSSQRSEFMMKRTLFTTLALTIACTALAPAAVNARPSLPLPTIAKPPALNGRIDATWATAAKAALAWDFSFRRTAPEATTAYLAADRHYLYVAFAARQREPLIATQLTSGAPLDNDDFVRISLWPAGESGFEYRFSINPAGTTYATSSENLDFSPDWRAAARVTPHGYTVTARIPLSVIRSSAHGSWRVQFDRQIRSSNELLEWAFSPAQVATDSVLYAGLLQAAATSSLDARTKPRVAIYGLSKTSGAGGGTIMTAGLDASIPLTPTASFIASVHPDDSNVEMDQQSISPTVFARQYTEVRPFFTQGANYYNTLTCNDCVSYPLLYTPGIPTPRTGYAIEGVAGQVSFAGFDAIGASRNDNAQALHWKSPDQRYALDYQRTGVDFPGLHDTAAYYEMQAGNGHNFGAYAVFGGEHGTLVTKPGSGRYREYGLGFYSAKAAAFLAFHDVGKQYAPVDSLTTINGVRGPSLFLAREWDFRRGSLVQSIKPTIDLQRLHDAQGRQNYGDNSLSVDIETWHQLSLSLNAGSTFIRLPNTSGALSNQNGVAATYRRNSSTPIGFSYNAGEFGDGRLFSSQFFAAARIARIATLSLQAAQTEQRLRDGSVLRQSLERASLAVQIGPNESIALGWRRIAGTGPVFFNAPQDIDATNLSLAYHKRFGSEELYLAYGSPNTLSTQHAILFKIIKYVGAEKGT
ncbi:MAG TPA: hypothetical protein VFN49_02380 [Candidatus Aquilonibacter sp.]|nr:hypothetical protein [Candidatus Aquilonibacter sp.]